VFFFQNTDFKHFLINKNVSVAFLCVFRHKTVVVFVVVFVVVECGL